MAATKRMGADLNHSANVLLAHGSRFYAWREEIYKRLLSVFVPRFPEFGGILRKEQGGKANATDDAQRKLLTERLAELKVICAEHGATLVTWIPPTASGDAGLERVVQAGQGSAVPVLVPILGAVMPAVFFVDGFHLDPEGAKIVTLALSSQLREILLQKTTN